MPISNWLSTYNKTDAVSDVIAGITIGLTLMPQSIAYASLANLGPQVWFLEIDLLLGMFY